MGACIVTILWIIVLLFLLGLLIRKCFLRFLPSVCIRDKNENLPTVGRDKYGHQHSKNVANTSVDYGKIVIALDIGTENMGYAFSCQTRKTQIYTAKNSGSHQYDRMPAAVLLNHDLSLKSVGFSAVSLHSKRALKKLQSDYIYIRHFKLILYEQEEVDSIWQDKVNVDDILCHVIGFLKKHALETTSYILSAEGEPIEEHIEWVLTTPNNQEAKEILSKAAKNAKLERFSFVLESDAAAWYCQRAQPTVSRQNEITNMSNGRKFIIADLGAGKTNICVYEMLSNGSLKQSFQSSQKIGGNSVNERFEKFMEKICGSNSWKDFRMSHAFDYEKLMCSFEEEKVKFDENTECIVLTLHQSLLCIVKTNENATLQERIEADNELLDKAELVQEKLFIDRRQMEEYFEPSLQNVQDTLKRIRQTFTVDDLRDMLVVGGYSASAFVRKQLKEKGKSFSIYIAFVQHPDMVVLKGAVMKGLEQ